MKKESEFTKMMRRSVSTVEEKAEVIRLSARFDELTEDQKKLFAAKVWPEVMDALGVE